ncbi:MAG: hypothetical protein JRC68_02475 [Deltaproteobacteria bacterium]|nr:hypothetical protein [Deltaproteobacteria bacterium]
MKQSRAKIWIRTVILFIFGTIFIIALYQDIKSGIFHITWALLVFFPSTVTGFLMRGFVPMHVHQAYRRITFSFDHIYFTLILLLVIAKVFTGQVPGLTIWTDIIMCVILGLMSGRLSGICLRVRDLKTRHFFSLDDQNNGKNES